MFSRYKKSTNASPVHPALMTDPEPAAAAAKRDDAPSEPATAVDPICQMTVQIAGALHTHEHDGQMYYFCCGGCRSRFAEDPGAYLAAG